MNKIFLPLLLIALLVSSVSSAGIFKYPIGTAFKTIDDVYIVSGYQGDTYELTSLGGVTYVDRLTVESWTPIEETFTQKLSRLLRPASFVGGILMPDYYGDVNGDGQLTIVDTLYIAQYTKGIRPACESGVTPQVSDCFNQYQINAADVNKDGKVTMDDALLIAKITVLLPIPKDVADNTKTLITVTPSLTAIPGPTSVQSTATPNPTATEELVINVNPTILPLNSNIPLNIQLVKKDGTPTLSMVRISGAGVPTTTMQTDSTGTLRYYPNPSWNTAGQITLEVASTKYKGSAVLQVQSAPTPTPTPQITSIVLTLDRTIVSEAIGTQAYVYATVKDNNGNSVQGAWVNGMQTDFFGTALITIYGTSSQTVKVTAIKGTLSDSKDVQLTVVYAPTATPTPQPTVAGSTNGYIIVWSSSPGTITLDGTQKGTTDSSKYVSIETSAGSHIVKITAPSYNIYAQTVDVVSGQQTKVDAYLTVIPVPTVSAAPTQVVPTASVTSTFTSIQTIPQTPVQTPVEPFNFKSPLNYKTPGFEFITAFIGILLVSLMVIRKKK